MATTISGINNALVDERVVPALRSLLPVLNMFSYAIEQEEKIQNDVVYVPIATDPSKATKTAGTMLTAGGTLAGTTVTLDTFEGAAWEAVEGTMRPELMSQYWADKAAGAVYVTAKGAIDAALALVTASNFGNDAADKLTVAPADFGQNDLADLWSKGTAKIKRQQKNVLLNTAYAAALFSDSSLATIFASAGNNFIASGTIPGFIGMNIAHYQDLPSNSQNLGGVVLGRAALLIGLARPSMLMQGGQGNIIERRVITDPDSGISCMYTVKGDAGGTMTGEVCLLYGVAKGQDAAVRLVSA